MSVSAPGLTEIRAPGGWAGPVIDVDVHVHVPSIQTLFPYMQQGWRDFIVERAVGTPPSFATVYPQNAGNVVRPEWRPENGGLAASSLELVREQALDAWAVERAILNCYWGIDSVRHPDLAATIARAVNDWLIDEWLDRDDRLRASLVVPAHTFADAVAEIERVGSHPGFVQVMMPVRAMQTYGRRNWWPVYDAIVAHDLVMGMTWGGTSEGPPTPSGWPSYYAEEWAGEQGVFMSQLTSMVAEGVFQRYPTFRLAVLDIGFNWVPSLMWRLNKEWKGLRRTIPWVNEAPSQIFRDHIRFTTAPLDAAPPSESARFLRWLGEEMVMFASDYPHAYPGDYRRFLDALPESARPKIMADNARAFYRL